MFDIGFWELTLIAVVALLVLGPERLPQAARTAGLWVGRARRIMSNLKSEIDREIKAEELKEIMAKQARSTGIHEIAEETQAAVEAAVRPKIGIDAGDPPPKPKSADEPRS